MNDRDRFGRDAQRYLDGEQVDGLDARQRAEADRLNNSVEAYASRLEVPGPEVDRAVMATIREEVRTARPSVWQWLFQPRTVSIRPAFAAVAAMLLVAAGAIGITVRHSVSPPAAVAPATVLVRFELTAPEAQRVTLVGSFNGWSPDQVELARSPDTGLWTGTVPLEPGEHQYLFVIDGGQWIPDPLAHAQVDDGFGQTNSVIVVGPRGVVRS